jgi:hypothetical protein
MLRDILDTVDACNNFDPVGFEDIAAEQNCFAETQCLLLGSSLKIAFQQAGAQCLVGNISTGFFLPVVPEKFRKNVFSKLAQYFTPSIDLF